MAKHPCRDDVLNVEVRSGSCGPPHFSENDANVGAQTKTRFGAAKDCHHLIFLTFGTGLGRALYLTAGFLMNEVAANQLGHRWVAGPCWAMRHGKPGGPESFCSGSDIVGCYGHHGPKS